MIDALILLSHGRVIYCGPADLAVSYFLTYPEYRSGLMAHVFIHLNVYICLYSTTELSPAAGAVLHLSIVIRKYSSHSIQAIIKLYYVLLYIIRHAEECSQPENPVDFLLRISCDTQAVHVLKSCGTYVYDKDTRTISKSACIDQIGTTSGYDAYLTAHNPSYVTVQAYIDAEKGVEPCTVADISEVNTHSKLSVSAIYLFIIRGIVISQRSFTVLITNWYLISVAVIMHLCFAFIFPITMGNSSEDEYAIMAFYGYGNMLLIVVGVLFAPFLMTAKEVFLKEYSRGLYSPVTHWLFGSIYYTLLRCMLALMFVSIAYHFLSLRTITEPFFLLAVVVHTYAAAAISELLVNTSADLRTAYTVIPAFAFLLFLCSSLMVKPSTYPELFKPWLPSISIVRWTMQAMTVNEFSDGENMGSIARFDVYTNLMILFGWGGKSKWLCLYYMCYNAVIYRVLVLYVMFKKAVQDSGLRSYRVVQEDEVNLYY